MKFIFAVIVVIGIFGSLASATVIQVINQQPYQTSAIQIPVSNLVQQQVDNALSFIVQNVLSNVIYYLVEFAIFVAPPKATIYIPTLITALQVLGNLDLYTLLSAVFDFVGVNPEGLLGFVPGGLLASQINTGSLLQFLVSNIPVGINSVPFPAVAHLFGDYLSNLLSFVV